MKTSDENSAEPESHIDVDVWSVLERSVAESTSAEKTPTKPSEDNQDETKTPLWKTWRWKAWFAAADCTGLVIWAYAVLKLFVFDVDRQIVKAIAPSETWIVDYRIFAVPIVLAIIGIFLWRVLALLFIAYVILFPFIIILWKVPWFIAKRRSWTLVMVSANVVSNAIRNIRYMAVSKSIWILCAGIILLLDGDVIVTFAAVCLMMLLTWSVYRATINAFQSNWFLRVQQSVIRRLMESGIFRSSWTITEKDLPAGSDEQDVVLTKEQAETLAGKIQAGAVVNRALYFWAYHLQDYKRTQSTLIMNSFAYAWLFIGSAFTFGLVNLALLKVDSSQFGFNSYPSNIAMIAYGMSTLFWSSVGDISADGDLAFLLVILAGLFGPLFLAVVVLNFLLTMRRERDESDLSDTIETLRDHARQHEAEFRADLRVSIAEAVDRLNRLGLVGILAAAEWLSRDLPPDFIDGEEPQAS